MERFYLTNETVSKNHCQINKKKQKNIQINKRKQLN